MSVITIAVLTSGLALAQAPTETAAPATAELPAEKTKTTGTRPVPKVGVKEAKEQCKKDGEKGRALATCIQNKINSQ